MPISMNFSGAGTQRLSVPHFIWNSDGADNFTEAFWPSLLHLLGGVFLTDGNTTWTTTGRANMIALGQALSASPHPVRWAIRHTPWATGPADPTDTTGDAAHLASDATNLDWIATPLASAGITPTVAFIDTEVWPASEAPVGEPDRAAWFAARAAKYQATEDLIRTYWPNIITDWYGRGTFFPQVNTSNVLNGQYTDYNWVSIDEDPGDCVSPVFSIVDQQAAALGSFQKRYTAAPSATRVLDAPLIWLGSHYKRNNTTGGTLQTRTDDNTGMVRFATNATYVVNETVDVTWTGGSRTGMTVTAVSGKDVTVDGGTGDILPILTTTGIAMGRYGNVDEAFTGFGTLAQYVRQTIKPHHVSFYPGAGKGVQSTLNETNWQNSMIEYVLGWNAATPRGVLTPGSVRSPRGVLRPRTS